MSPKIVMVFVALAASLCIYAQVEAGGFHGSYHAPGFSVSFSGPLYYSYWEPAFYGQVFYPYTYWRGHHHHGSHRFGEWRGGDDDHGWRGGHRGRGRGGNR
jgi:hypothetical protein